MEISSLLQYHLFRNRYLLWRRLATYLAPYAKNTQTGASYPDKSLRTGFHRSRSPRFDPEPFKARWRRGIPECWTSRQIGGVSTPWIIKRLITVICKVCLYIFLCSLKYLISLQVLKLSKFWLVLARMRMALSFRHLSSFTGLVYSIIWNDSCYHLQSRYIKLQSKFKQNHKLSLNSNFYISPSVWKNHSDTYPNSEVSHICPLLTTLSKASSPSTCSKWICQTWKLWWDTINQILSDKQETFGDWNDFR